MSFVSFNYTSSEDEDSPDATDTDGPIPCTKCIFPLERHLMPMFEPGDTPLINAAFEGHTKCLKAWLDAGVDVNIGNFRHENALHHAAKMAQPECAQILLEAGANADGVNSNGDSALILSIRDGHMACVNVILRAGADMNLSMGEGETALIAASKSRLGNENLRSRPDEDEVRNLEPTCIQRLIDAGADVNMADINGVTALMNAVFWDHAANTTALLQSGAQVNVTNRNGVTALRCTRGPQTAALLLKAGAMINTARGSATGSHGVDQRRDLVSRHDDVTFHGLTPRAVRTEPGLAKLLFAAGQRMPIELEGRVAKVMGISQCNTEFCDCETISIGCRTRSALPLLHLAREAIRGRLINLEPTQHLFQRIPLLGLPSSLSAYLLYYQSIAD